MTLLYPYRVCVTDPLAFLFPVVKKHAIAMCVCGQRENQEDDCHNDWVIKSGPEFCDSDNCHFDDCLAYGKWWWKNHQGNRKGDSIICQL